MRCRTEESISNESTQRGAMAAGLWPKKRLPVANRNGEVRAAELPHHGKINSDHFALVIEKRTAGAARGGLGVIDNLVRQHVANMTLCGDRSDQVTTGQFFYHLL